MGQAVLDQLSALCLSNAKPRGEGRCVTEVPGLSVIVYEGWDDKEGRALHANGGEGVVDCVDLGFVGWRDVVDFDGHC